jgi:shikimate dehydrogenase
MDRYVVIGNPVAHSRSPQIHALFAAQTQQALCYERLCSPLDAFAATVAEFAADGGRGCNVTVPFKQAAYALADRSSARAHLSAAANVLRFEADGVYADNTDGVGLVCDLEHNAGRRLQGQRVLLIGAGGAAAGALGALIAAHPCEIVLCNRSLDKAQRLAERHQDWSAQHQCLLRAASLSDCGEGFDVLINATASSLQGAPVPVSSSVLAPGSLVLDMMYGPAAQPMMDWASRHGALARDGLGMLVEQAAESFFIWRGVRPDSASVLQQLR